MSRLLQTRLLSASVLKNILREMHNKQDRYAEICQHYLDILILYFCRKDHVSYEVVDAQNSSRECHKVKTLYRAQLPEHDLWIRLPKTAVSQNITFHTVLQSCTGNLPSLT